jgi:hypothetical protein
VSNASHKAEPVHPMSKDTTPLATTIKPEEMEPIYENKAY